jgi:Flp pilus assembly pilin Flp
MNTLINKLRSKFSSRRDEKGMEAAQVILILVVVVLVLIPVVSQIAKSVSSRGSLANDSITNVGN